MRREEEIKAKTEGQSAVSLIAVDFSQRIKKYIVRIGLQPHSMWLKPVFDCNYSARQLKQTAMNSAALSNCSAVSIAPEKSGQAFDFSQRNREHDNNSGLQPNNMWLKPDSDNNFSFRQLKQTAIDNSLSAAETKRNSTVFQTIKPSALGIFHFTEGCISGSQPVRA